MMMTWKLKETIKINSQLTSKSIALAKKINHVEMRREKEWIANLRKSTIS